MNTLAALLLYLSEWFLCLSICFLGTGYQNTFSHYKFSSSTQEMENQKG